MNIKRLISISFFFLFINIIVCAQVITFEKNYGLFSNIEAGNSLQQTMDGGYIILGAAVLASVDLYLIKVDSLGIKMWERTYGGSDWEGLFYYTSDVKQTADSGYIIVAGTLSYGAGDKDAYIIKTNSNGDTLWTKTFGSVGVDYATGVEPTTDGGYVVSGWIEHDTLGAYDIFLNKLDGNGNMLWSKRYFEPGYYETGSLQKCSDGGYIIAAATQLIKTDSAGNLLWEKPLGESAEFVRQSSDGGFIICSTTDVNYSTKYYDIAVIKTDANGDTSSSVGSWKRTFGGTRSDFGYGVWECADNGYIVTGTTCSYGWAASGFGCDIWLLKLDSTGTMLWNKTFGNIGSDLGRFVQETKDGGYVITGEIGTSFSSDVYLIKTNNLGEIDTNITSINNLFETNKDIMVNVYPNPFSTSATIRINPVLLKNAKDISFAIYNLLGREVKIVKSIENQQVTITRDNLPSGLYIYKIYSKKRIIYTGKLSIQ